MPASVLDVLLPSLADDIGKAVPTALRCHRHIAAGPAMIVPFRIGGESFAVSALAMGFSRTDFDPLVVPDPRNRALFFDRITPFARKFDEWFMSFASQRDEDGIATNAPQLVMPNRASASLLAAVGRRLAYIDASYSVDPAVTATGRHFQFLKDHLRVPGQQLVLSLTDILASHWATAQTPGERLSLPALAAWIQPPPGIHGFDAAVAAEADDGVGPLLPASRDIELFGLVEAYAAALKAGDAAAACSAEIGIHAHWTQVLGSAWGICWDALAQIRNLPLAPSTRQRWRQDCEAYTRHAEWQRTGGRRRVRPTVRQAAETHSRLEAAAAMLTTQEAIDDPLRMAPYVLRDEAIIGTVVAIDPENVERSPGGQRRRYPLVTLETPQPCGVAVGKQLWWTADPNKERPWIVREVVQPRRPSQRWRITLRRAKAATNQTRLPTIQEDAAYSVLNLTDYQTRFPGEADMPWTHRLRAGVNTAFLQGAIDSEPIAGEPSAADAAPDGFDVADALNVPGEE
jgi:hypothetical protein